MAHTSLPCGLLLVAAAAAAARAQECSTLPLVTPIGAGTPGSAGIPELHTVGQPMVNQPGMGLRITGGAPGAAAQLVVGAPGSPQVLAAYGARLYPASPFTRFALTVGRDGSTPTLLSGPAATSPALCGAEFVAQGLVVDPAAQGGLAFTGGTALRFGVGSSAASLYPGAKFTTHWTDGIGSPGATAAGDLNGDGLTDVAVALSGAPFTNIGAGVRVMLQLSDGQLWSGSYLETGTLIPNDVSLVDLDGDSVLDLVAVAAPQQPGGGPGAVAIGLGVGDGTFVAQPLITEADARPVALAVADLDGDGLPELGVGPWTAQGGCAVFPNLGAGHFGTPSGLPPMGEIRLGSLRFADLDGDGRLDLLGLVPPEHLGVHAGLGGGALGPPFLEDLGTSFCDQLAVADLDADGDEDLAVTDHGSFFPPVDPSLKLYWNTAGQLSAPQILLTSIKFYTSPSAADLDGDGLPEIVARASAELLVTPNLGGGAFGSALMSKIFAAGLLLADMDGDGRVDLVATNDSSVFWYAGTGDGWFVFPPKLPEPWTSPRAVADVNLDDHFDLVGAGSSGALQVVLGAGDGTFGPPIDSAAACRAAGRRGRRAARRRFTAGCRRDPRKRRTGRLDHHRPARPGRRAFRRRRRDGAARRRPRAARRSRRGWRPRRARPDEHARPLHASRRGRRDVRRADAWLRPPCVSSRSGT
jgi:hypothetical protein